MSLLLNLGTHFIRAFCVPYAVFVSFSYLYMSFSVVVNNEASIDNLFRVVYYVSEYSNVLNYICMNRCIMKFWVSTRNGTIESSWVSVSWLIITESIRFHTSDGFGCPWNCVKSSISCFIHFIHWDENQCFVLHFQSIFWNLQLVFSGCYICHTCFY